MIFSYCKSKCAQTAASLRLMWYCLGVCFCWPWYCVVVIVLVMMMMMTTIMMMIIMMTMMKCGRKFRPLTYKKVTDFLVQFFVIWMFSLNLIFFAKVSCASHCSFSCVKIQMLQSVASLCYHASSAAWVLVLLRLQTRPFPKDIDCGCASDLLIASGHADKALIYSISPYMCWSSVSKYVDHVLFSYRRFSVYFLLTILTFGHM